ncbi:unnamed protein product [Linum tenue]|uniref:Uncharacterized protein n=1 Tax=Linum tenue TaxID=586396 RepID=A0AAV0MGE9_9ROSI|nr:unnamed protein product [Linum tenue]
MDPVECHRSAAELLQAQTHIYNHTFSFINSMALKSAVELGIADVIHTHGKPITLAELVAALNIGTTKTAYVYRLMRVLVHSGFFRVVEEAYVLTPSSKLLVKDDPNCLSTMVKMLTQPEFLTLSHVLKDWIKDGQVSSSTTTAFEKAHGMAFWEYANGKLEFNALFNEAMACDSAMMNMTVRVCGVVFQGIDSLVDVGGGTGTFGRILTEAFPGMKCKVLELPQVIDHLTGTSGSLEFVQGDMFQHVPSAHAVLLKTILHDWNDEECVKILKKCKEAVLSRGEGGKVIIIDIVMNEKKDEHELAGTKLLYDLLMMLVVNGKERSEKEWERLFLEAGFKHYKITALVGLRSLIEVFP